MPRKKVVAPKSYTKQDLEDALLQIRQNVCSVKKAASNFKIPRSTLIAHLKGWKNRSVTRNKKPGRQVDLSEEVEKTLAEHIRTLNRWGFGLSRKEIIALVASYVKENNIKTRFKDGIPGKDWFIGFCRRNNFSCKKPIKRQTVRTEQTRPEVVYGFFDLYEETVRQLGLLDKPSQIFNLDETSLCSDPSNTKVVSEKNKSVFRHTHGTGRSNTSILFCISANGEKLPPFILYHAKHLWDIWMPDGAYPNTGYAATKSGWMTEVAFCSWFENHFLKYAPKERPLLLIFDGHASHVSVKLIEIAMRENITLLKLPPHTTHFLQPLDSLPFGVFKKSWDEKLCTWQRENYGRPLTKAEFSILVGQVWGDFPERLLRRSFQITGLYDENLPEGPINRKAIRDSMFKPLELEEYFRSQASSSSQNLQTQSSTISSEVPSTDTSVCNTPAKMSPKPMVSNTPVNMSPKPSCSSERLDGAVVVSQTGRSLQDLILAKIGRQAQQSLSKRKRVGTSNFADVLTREDYLNDLKKSKEKKQKTVSKKQLPQSESSSDSEDEVNHEINSSGSDIETLEQLVEQEKEALNEENVYNEIKEMKAGCWVLVNYKTTNKIVKRYIGQVLEVQNLEDSIKVKFVRKKSTYFIWPLSEDIDTVNVNEIYTVLANPTEDKRGRIKFSLSFDGLNVY